TWCLTTLTESRLWYRCTLTDQNRQLIIHGTMSVITCKTRMLSGVMTLTMRVPIPRSWLISYLNTGLLSLRSMDSVLTLPSVLPIQHLVRVHEQVSMMHAVLQFSIG